MRKKFLEIYVDRLKEGRVEKIQQRLEPEFLQIDDPDLAFKEPVEIEGEVYIAQTDLVLRLQLKSSCRMPCSICNENITVPLFVPSGYHAISLDEVKGAIYDAGELIRQALLLEIPSFTECQGGRCPQREQVDAFLHKQESPLGEKIREAGRFPFAHLDFKDAKVVEEPQEIQSKKVKR
jgi:hypothetical protein